MTAPPTLNHLFFDAVERFSTKRAALRYKVDGVWRDISHQELARRVYHAALGLHEFGIRPGDRVAIYSHNRPEWAIADYACLTARCADVAIYPALPGPQIAYLIRDSGATAIFVGDREQYEQVQSVRGSLPQLKTVFMFGPPRQGDDVIPFQQLLRHGAAAEAKYPRYRQDALATAPDDLATLIYTSGTTGEPKGVMLTHANFCANVVAALQVVRIGPTDSCLSALPLAHSFERMAGHYTMLHGGATINYAESLNTIAQDLLEVRPTVVLLVPRVYEKIYARVTEVAMAGGAVSRRVFFWARRIGAAYADLKLAGHAVPLGLRVRRRMVDRLVFRKLRARTGGRIRFFVSGAAPLAPEIAKFFYAAGLPVLEGYGLTETSPLVSVNTLKALKIGTVGRPVPNVEVRIAEDGEILVRGPNVMQGYYHKPQATAEAIDAQGWFHTGDIGDLDADGFLRITDRKKDIIVTAGGKKIAPQPIENLVRNTPFLKNAVLIGDQRKFPVLLVVPAVEALVAWAAQRGLPTDDLDRFLEQPDVTAKIEREAMINLRDLASFEMPKKIVVINDDFTIERGELTPTLKVKRAVVEKKYQALIDAAYAE
ncbi:MAG: long-chain fatty acid--CoA ligase [Gemmatimonadetes bacterium]|nr:long-chain fatty acid--CoA ligase [Gemmatimonadota bacterium]